VNASEHRLARVFAATVAAVDPATATARALGGGAVRDALAGRRVWVAAVGKAARAMADGAVAALGARIAGGIVVAPTPGPVAAPLVLVPADHPVPGIASEAAGKALLALASSVPPHHRLLALVSGGASSLAAVPGTGLTLAAKVAQVQAAVTAGAPISEVNRLRISLSGIKGGRLAARCLAPVVTLVISDVVGDDLAVVGSGPTVGPAAIGRPDDRAMLASGIGDLAGAACQAARTILGCDAEIVDPGVVGDVEQVASRVATAIRRALAKGGPGGLIWTGEPTIRLTPRPGRGGRARHLALLIARELRDHDRWALLAAGSDGVDGTSDAAGAVVDGNTWAMMTAAGHDPARALASCDTGPPLAAVHASLVTGPTGVNHADLLVAEVAASVL
jgi:hydroxypyruvate reductase